MADKPKDALEETMGMVKRLAMKIVEMPIERRPEGFMVLREALIEAAKEMKLEGTKRDEFANHAVSAIESLVRDIEARGGSGKQ